MSKIYASNRAEARLVSRENRLATAENARREADEARLKNLLAVVDGCESVAVYLSAPPEPDTTEFVRRWPKPLYVPVLRTFKKTKTPDWTLLQPGTLEAATRPGWQGIPEPLAEPLAEPIAPDAIIISALAADGAGNRLGTGGGWFDRALAPLPNGCLKVCLLNSREIVGWVEPESHDVPVDVLVTESGWQWSTVSSRKNRVPNRK